MDLFRLEREGFIFGDTHPAINGIKMFLNRHYAVSEKNLTLNSEIDIPTQTAIKNYQKFKGLPITERADILTLKAILSEMTSFESQITIQSAPYIWSKMNVIKNLHCGYAARRTMTVCEKALAKLFTHKDFGVILVDTNDNDAFDYITLNERRGTFHDHLYNDPAVVDIQTPTNFYIPRGGKVIKHFGWNSARKRINTPYHKLNKDKDELYENQEITVVHYEKFGKLRNLVFQIWHLDPFINQLQPDGSILLGRMGKDGLLRYGKVGAPMGFHIHINIYRQWWKGAPANFSQSLFPSNPGNVRVYLSELCSNGQIVL